MCPNCHEVLFKELEYCEKCGLLLLYDKDEYQFYNLISILEEEYTKEVKLMEILEPFNDDDFTKTRTIRINEMWFSFSKPNPIFRLLIKSEKNYYINKKSEKKFRTDILHYISRYETYRPITNIKKTSNYPLTYNAIIEFRFSLYPPMYGNMHGILSTTQNYFSSFLTKYNIVLLGINEVNFLSGMTIAFECYIKYEDVMNLYNKLLNNEVNFNSLTLNSIYILNPVNEFSYDVINKKMI